MKMRGLIGLQKILPSKAAKVSALWLRRGQCGEQFFNDIFKINSRQWSHIVFNKKDSNGSPIIMGANL